MPPAAFIHFLLVFAIAFSSRAVFAAPGDGIANSAHDFARGTRSGSTGLCNTCHVPRTAMARTLAWDPGATGDWTEQNAPPMRRTGASREHRGPSEQCLSCHDGTVAVGDSGSLPLGGGAQETAALRRLAGTYETAHPVPMPYPYAGARSTYNGVTAHAREADGLLPDPTTGNIRLYSDDGRHITARPKPGATGIECSSCHDPHNTEARERRLLRAGLDGASKASGYLCSQCHGLR